MCCVGIVSIHGFGTGRARRLGGGSRFSPLPVVHDEDDDVIRCGRDAAWSCCGVRLLSGGERTAAYTSLAWLHSDLRLSLLLPDPGAFIRGDPQKLLPDPGSPTHQQCALAWTTAYHWECAE